MLSSSRFKREARVVAADCEVKAAICWNAFSVREDCILEVLRRNWMPNKSLAADA